MDNIYEALRESHELQRNLCRQLVRIKPDDPRAQETFRELRIELAAHAAAEERFLYAPILLDDLGLKPSRHALAEHHDIEAEPLFDERLQPELPRPAVRRLKIEQDQEDRSGLCTNTVGGAVHGLWKHGARPEPMGLRRQRLLFAQRHLTA